MVIKAWTGPAPPRPVPQPPARPMRAENHWNGSGWSGNPPQAPQAAFASVVVEQMQSRLHNSVYSAAVQAAAAVAPIEPAEGEWSESEITKRIAKHIYKAAADPELLKMPWDRVCKEVVQRAMQGYSASCGDAAWFFYIDLPPVFSAAIWEILMTNGHAHHVNSSSLENAIVEEYEALLDRALLDKAMWHATSNMFSDPKVQSKVFQAVSRSYWPALDDTLIPIIMQEEMRGPATHDTELKHVESFVRRWMSDSMCRASGSVEQFDSVLTADVMTQLFHTLIAPFGVEDPFTCIPGALTEQIGRPPADWPWIAQAVQEMLDTWAAQPVGGGSSKKKKRSAAAAAAEGEGGMPEPELERRPEEENEAPPKSKKKKKSNAAANAAPAEPYPRNGKVKAKFKGFGMDEEEEGTGPYADEASSAKQCIRVKVEKQPGGNPRCTSEEDCIGTPGSRLIRHQLDGQPGDVYCEPCWDSFFRRNPTLEGTWLDE